TGPAINRPRSATLRTVDIAGLDVLIHVANDLAGRLPPEQAKQFTFPPFLHEMHARGWIGEKAGHGFYQRKIAPSGETEIWALDTQTLEYRPRHTPHFASLETHASAALPDRMRKLYEGHDRVGEFFRATLAPTLRYALQVAP